MTDTPEPRVAHTPVDAAAEPTNLVPRLGAAVLGASLLGARAGVAVTRTGLRLGAPVVSAALDPPLVPTVLRPATYVGVLADVWDGSRSEVAADVAAAGRATVPNLTAAGLRLVDVPAVTTAVLDQVDLDALVVAALARVDLDALVDRIVERLDIAAIVADVLGRLDLTALVVERVDLARVVHAALDDLDLTAVVVDQVDLGRVVTAALDQLDLTSIVTSRVDLPAITTSVIEEIDLAGTIRESTTSVAGELIRAARLSSVDADRAVARWVDRMAMRRRARQLDAPGDPESFGPPPTPDEAAPAAQPAEDAADATTEVDR